MKQVKHHKVFIYFFKNLLCKSSSVIFYISITMYLWKNWFEGIFFSTYNENISLKVKRIKKNSFPYKQNVPTSKNDGKKTHSTGK